MLERERHAAIVRLLKQNRFATVKEMVQLLDISEATIRRDLVKLSREGAIARIRGGAELAGGEADSPHPPRLPEAPLDLRIGVLAEKKRMIAKKAVSLIGTDETVIIDGGSTTFYMTEFLKGLAIQVVTNSFAIAEVLVKHSKNTVICSGGIIYPDSQIILNPFDNTLIRNYYSSKVFMGIKGIDENGATNSDPLLIAAEREMVESGEQLILLADSSKFTARGNLRLCGFDKIHTIITDRDLAAEHKAMVLSKNVRLIIV